MKNIDLTVKNEIMSEDIVKPLRKCNSLTAIKRNELQNVASN